MERNSHWVRRMGVLFLLMWSLVPLYWVLNISLQTDAQISAKPANYLPPTPSLSNYVSLLSGTGALPDAVRRSMVNISIECGLATIVTVLLSTLAAYAFARMKFRGRTVLFYSVLATMAFPAYTTLIPLYRIMTTFGLVNTYTGIILVYVSGFLPLATWIMYHYMSSLPISIEEAAQVDGASRMKVLWLVVLPLARPGIVAVAVIVAVFTWNDFGGSLVLLQKPDVFTAPLAISRFSTFYATDQGLTFAGMAIAIVPPLLLFLVLQRSFIGGLTAGAIRR